MRETLKEINTTRFGTLEMSDEAIIRFPEGIPGFENHHEWVIAGDDENPVKWMQSLKDPDVALPVAPPSVVITAYNAKLPESDLEVLESKSQDDLAMLVVLSIPPKEPWNITVNLRAPIVVNHARQIAKQVIAINEEYDVRHLLFPESTRAMMKSRYEKEIAEEAEAEKAEKTASAKGDA